jgi:hypothetical protein
MRKCFTVLVVLVAFWISFPAQAQTETHLSSVSVEIWPEYDQPAVLVICHITLSADETLPANLNLRVPAKAEVYAVAVSDATGSLLNTPYDRTVQGSWASLKITASSRDVQVEYYEDLVKNGTTRHIVYEWAGDYVVDAFAVALQQPLDATDMVTNPVLTNERYPAMDTGRSWRSSGCGRYCRRLILLEKRYAPHTLFTQAPCAVAAGK